MIDNNIDMKYRYLLALLVAIGQCWACSTEDDEYMNPSIIEDQAILSGPSNIDLYPLGDEYTVTFTSPVEWFLDSKPNWLNVNPNQGSYVSGTTTLNLNVNVNDDNAVREAISYFLPSYNQSGYAFAIPITFKQPRPVLFTNIDSMWFDWNETSIDFAQLYDVRSNVFWKVKTIYQSDASPVTAEHFSLPAESVVNRNGAEINVFPKEWNLGIEPYNIHVVLMPVRVNRDSSVVEVTSSACPEILLKLCQKNLRFLIDGSVESAEYTLNELNTNPIDLQVDAESPWHIEEIPYSDFPDWAEFSVDNGVGITDIVLKADGVNPTTERRSGWVRLMTDAGAYRDIYVSQDPYIFNFTGGTSFSDNNDEAYIVETTTLNTTGSWEISGVPSWAEVTPLSGTDTTLLTIKTLERNMSTEDVTANIRVASTLNSVSQNLNLTLEAFDFDIVYDEDLFASIPTLSTGPFDLEIQASGDWEIRNVSNWIHLSRTSGTSGRTMVTVTVDPIDSSSEEDRTGSFTVVSLEHEKIGATLTHTVNMLHKKYVYNVTGDMNISYPAYSQNYDIASVDVECSVDWSVAECPDWITPSVRSGIGSGVVNVRFTPDANTSTEARSGTIVIRTNYDAPYNGETTINVTQEGFVFDNTEPVTHVDISESAGGLFTVPFTMTAEAGWSVIVSDDWITANPTSGSGSGSVVFTIPANDQLTSRSGTARIRSTLTGQEKQISFTQLPCVYSVDTDALNYTYNSLVEPEVVVECSGAWSVSSNADWVKFNVTQGDGNGSFIITVLNNQAYEERSATVTVTSTLNGLTHTISITQGAAPEPEPEPAE